ncbi:hypothetical protein Y032_0362g3489 [Ancylostoma ceylanicum]|uniref:Reverse transcriptase domain-containing protein n=1 Tax=Ancylostoma ceylanicum TaxID=53326 RepID=A0A016RV85_9BILA|nr:hypothetical protein Y032_0362g3489 [Ancylostoma ceylanicum]
MTVLVGPDGMISSRRVMEKVIYDFYCHLSEDGYVMVRYLTRYLSECKVPSQWKTSATVLLYRKGDPQDIGNYRPIWLLSVVYKLFTRVILNRIERTLL